MPGQIKRKGYSKIQKIERETIVFMWSEGYSTRSIARVIDSTPTAVAGRIRKLRKLGYDLPMRNNLSSLGRERQRENGRLVMVRRNYGSLAPEAEAVEAPDL